MKIGIITFTDGTNYGQRLQNYALQELLKSHGNEVYTIKQGHTYSLRHKIKVIIKSALNIKNTLQKQNRKKAFARFNNRYINFYKESLPEEGSKAMSDSFDLFVAGSDQIWNPNSPFVGSNMFMQFAPKEKRATYAASFSVDSINDEKKTLFAKWISEIRNVSVRELRAVELVEELTGRKPTLNLDPTLLLEHEKWETMVNNAESTVVLPERYMISLFLGNVYREEEELISRQTGLTLIRYGNYETAGPDEFLRIVRDASLVLTDSYHVTIFSLLFKTPFIVFRRQSKGGSMNSRFETLNFYFRIDSRFYENVKIHGDFLGSIDGDRFEKVLSKLRKDSWEYLDTILEHA